MKTEAMGGGEIVITGRLINHLLSPFTSISQIRSLKLREVTLPKMTQKIDEVRSRIHSLIHPFIQHICTQQPGRSSSVFWGYRGEQKRRW